MLLALSDSVLLGIVTAVLSLVGTIFTGVMTYLMARLNQKADETKRTSEDAAVKVREVKEELHKTTTETASKLDDVAAQVHEVHLATNSMHDAIVAKTDEAAFARGKADKGNAPASVAERVEQTMEKVEKVVEKVDRAVDEHKKT